MDITENNHLLIDSLNALNGYKVQIDSIYPFELLKALFKKKLLKAFIQEYDFKFDWLKRCTVIHKCQVKSSNLFSKPFQGSFTESLRLL